MARSDESFGSYSGMSGATMSATRLDYVAALLTPWDALLAPSTPCCESIATVSLVGKSREQQQRQ